MARNLFCLRRLRASGNLMLQLLLLTEEEITAMLNLNRQIARAMGLNKAADRPIVQELSQHTSIDDVTPTIQENLPGSE